MTQGTSYKGAGTLSVARGAVFLLLTACIAACGGSIAPDPAPGKAREAQTATVLSTCTSTDLQNSPVISGSNVVWVDFPEVANDFDLVYMNLATSAVTRLTNTPNDDEYLPDIDGTTLVYTHTGSQVISGDIDEENVSTLQTLTVAGSTEITHFAQPAVSGNIAVFLRLSSQTDVFYWNLGTGLGGYVTNDPAQQANPRTDGNLVVYEDYNTGQSAIMGFNIASNGPPFTIASGSTPATQPDIDGGIVVYVGQAGGSDQIFVYDSVTKMTFQVTTAVSRKIEPRISAGRVVWSDDRNGNLDLYGYDLTAQVELPVVTGPFDQFLADIDGNQVVYTTTETGCQSVSLATFPPPPPPPPSVASIAVDVQNGFASGDIKNPGIENALLSKLAAAAALRAQGDCADAAAVYQAFINSVNAQAGKGISTTEAQLLVSDAEYLIAHCP